MEVFAWMVVVSLVHLSSGTSTCPVSHQSSNLFSVHVPEFGMQLNASRLNSPVLVTLDNIPTNCNLHLGNVTLATNCSDKISVSLLQESLEINYNSLPALTRVVEDDDGDHAGSFVQVTFRMPEKNYALKSSVHLIIRIKKDNEGSGTSRTGASSPCAIWSDYNSHARSFTRNCSGQSKEQPSHYCIDALTRTPRPFLIYHFKAVNPCAPGSACNCAALLVDSCNQRSWQCFTNTPCDKRGACTMNPFCPLSSTTVPVSHSTTMTTSEDHHETSASSSVASPSSSYKPPRGSASAAVSSTGIKSTTATTSGSSIENNESQHSRNSTPPCTAGPASKGNPWMAVAYAAITVVSVQLLIVLFLVFKGLLKLSANPRRRCGSLSINNTTSNLAYGIQPCSCRRLNNGTNTTTPELGGTYDEIALVPQTSRRPSAMSNRYTTGSIATSASTTGVVPPLDDYTMPVDTINEEGGSPNSVFPALCGSQDIRPRSSMRGYSNGGCYEKPLDYRTKRRPSRDLLSPAIPCSSHQFSPEATSRSNSLATSVGEDVAKRKEGEAVAVVAAGSNSAANASCSVPDAYAAVTLPKSRCISGKRDGKQGQPETCEQPDLGHMRDGEFLNGLYKDSSNFNLADSDRCDCKESLADSPQHDTVGSYGNCSLSNKAFADD